MTKDSKTLPLELLFFYLFTKPDYTVTSIKIILICPEGLGFRALRYYISIRDTTLINSIIMKVYYSRVSTDRLGRNTIDVLRTWQELTELGIRVVCRNPNLRNKEK